MNKIILNEDIIVNGGFTINGKDYSQFNDNEIKDICLYLMNKNFAREDWIIELQNICKNYGKYGQDRTYVLKCK